jgi:hypothetical protein
MSGFNPLKHLNQEKLKFQFHFYIEELRNFDSGLKKKNINNIDDILFFVKIIFKLKDKL